jgi:pimeloyl-ACP methyl ester carboxylesterase
METANATAQSAADASSSPAIASQYPPPREGDWEARNFQFGAGEVFDRLSLHYTTIGQRLLRHRHERRDPRASEGGAHARGGRPSGERTAGGAFTADANDFLYQWDASRDYDPGPGLERIRGPVLAINSADDERDPPETGIMARQLARLKNARLYLIPASEETAGHGTTGMAKFWKRELESFLRELPRRLR